MEGEAFQWVEEYQSSPCWSRANRKLKSKKEFIGWASKPLLHFLETIGKDTSKQLSQDDVTSIVNDYINKNGLRHPVKKKRVLCDDNLQFLFGRKTVARIKIHDLLDPHFAENLFLSDDDSFFNSDQNDDEAFETLQKSRSKQKKVVSPLKSRFAAVIPDNIKLIYLKRSLVEDLLRDGATFETKVIGSFVRVKCDPNDYLQKNSHQLLQVTGVKASATTSTDMKALLEVSSFIKDIHISMLSDDDFSQEECEDLRQRVKNGLNQRPTIVELEQKAQILHEDITKHWLAREISLLQNYIDRANEKGWRRELFEYLERKELLQKPSEQSRLLQNIPNVIAEELEVKASVQEFADNPSPGYDGSPASIHEGDPEISSGSAPVNQIVSNQISSGINVSDGPEISVAEPRKHSNLARGERKEEIRAANSRSESSQKADEQPVRAREVIDLSDGEKDESNIPDGSLDRPIWHYLDPQGEVQGPFSISTLKRWNDADYFPSDFRVWRTGQSQDEAVILRGLLCRMFLFVDNL